MDRLEKFIRENRASFDDRNPPANIWYKINNKLDKSDPRQVHIGSYLWRAAAIFLFIAVVWLLIDRTKIADQVAQVYEISDDSQISFDEVENFYFQEIQAKQKLIVKFVSDHPEMDKDLLGEISQLDSTYQILKSTAEKGYSEKIIDAMVLNLQMRIDILNQQIEVLEKIKNLKENDTANI
jgi:hypothetical protein